MSWALQNWEKSGFFVLAMLPFMVNWGNLEFLKDDRTRCFLLVFKFFNFFFKFKQVLD